MSDTTSRNFIYLNVRGLLNRYENPTEQWHDVVRALSQTQVDFFRANELLEPRIDPLEVIDDLVLRFSDFNNEGQAFIRSQGVERWLASYDRKGNLEAYRNAKGLESRLSKFRKARQI